MVPRAWLQRARGPKDADPSRGVLWHFHLNKTDPCSLNVEIRILSDSLSRPSSEIAVSPFAIPAEDPYKSTSADAFTTTSPFTILERDKLVVPQKPLYAAYAVAIQKLSKYSRATVHALLRERQNRPSVAAGDVPSDLADTEDSTLASLEAITRIVLLQNPEHLRALNLRKRLLLARSSQDSQQRLQDIRDELHWTKLVLGVAANAKMGTLWSHRKWLLGLLDLHGDTRRILLTADSPPHNDHSLHHNVSPLLPPADFAAMLQDEIRLVDLCSHRYPRNYTAWAYRSRLFRRFSPSVNVNSTATSSWQLEREHANLSEHLRLNIRDHTAAHHILTILAGCSDQAHTQHRACSDDFARRKVQSETVILAFDLVNRYPGSETPWLLLRGVVHLAIFAGRVSEDGEKWSGTILKQAVDLSRSKWQSSCALPDQDAPRSLETDRSEESGGWRQEDAKRITRYSRRALHFFESHLTLSEPLCSEAGRTILEQARA